LAILAAGTPLPPPWRRPCRKRPPVYCPGADALGSFLAARDRGALPARRGDRLPAAQRRPAQRPGPLPGAERRQPWRGRQPPAVQGAVVPPLEPADLGGLRCAFGG